MAKNQGRNLPADGSAGPTVIPVVTPAAGDGPDLEWGSRVVAAGFAVDLDAAILIDAMSAAHLAHTRAAILGGERPDGGGAQDPLRARTLADPERQSEHRGYRTGLLADELRRTEIVSDRHTASCRILPPVARNAYVGRERKLGRELLTVRGAAGAAVVAAARAAAAEMVSGLEVGKNSGEVAAKDATK